MHAASDRGPQIQVAGKSQPAGKIRAALLIAAFLAITAGCSNGSSDNPGVQPPAPATTASGTQAPAGPTVTMAILSGLPVPQLAGKTAVNTDLRALATHLNGSCTATVPRDDPKVASVTWKCGGARPVTATFDLRDQRQLTLGDIFQGAYQSYLTSTGQAQLQANGVASPDATDLSVWYLTPGSLVVVFPQGSVSYPVSSLTQYLRPGGVLTA